MCTILKADHKKLLNLARRTEKQNSPTEHFSVVHIAIYLFAMRPIESVCRGKVGEEDNFSAEEEGRGNSSAQASLGDSGYISRFGNGRAKMLKSQELELVVGARGGVLRPPDALEVSAGGPVGLKTRRRI